MADLPQRDYSAAYSGLVKNLWLTIGIAGVCLIGYEIEVHMPRRRGRRGTFQRIPIRLYQASKRAWKRWKCRTKGPAQSSRKALWNSTYTIDEKLAVERERIGDRESWEFGYIYQPKSWALNRGPPLPRWPLMWIISSLRVRERDMPEKCGLDLTLHARFLRGCCKSVRLGPCADDSLLHTASNRYCPAHLASPTHALRPRQHRQYVNAACRNRWTGLVLRVEMALGPCGARMVDINNVDMHRIMDWMGRTRIPAQRNR